MHETFHKIKYYRKYCIYGLLSRILLYWIQWYFYFKQQAWVNYKTIFWSFNCWVILYRNMIKLEENFIFYWKFSSFWPYAIIWFISTPVDHMCTVYNLQMCTPYICVLYIPYMCVFPAHTSQYANINIYFYFHTCFQNDFQKNSEKLFIS